MSQLMYFEYETKVAELISEALECSYSDASGMLEALQVKSYVERCFCTNVHFNETANEIINQNADLYLNDEK